MNERIKQLLFLLKEHKQIIGYGAGTVALLLTLSTLTTNLVTSYNERSKKEQQIATMTSTVTEYTSKSKQIADLKNRPVAMKDVDKVQTEVIFNIQSFGLDIQSMKEDQAHKKDSDGRSFVVEFTGDYEPSIRCVEDFHSKKGFNWYNAFADANESWKNEYNFNLQGVYEMRR